MRREIELSVMRLTAERLIRDELRPGNPTDTEGHSAFRVCEKLRGPLSVFAGTAGYTSLLSRAFTLAKGEVPWLRQLDLTPAGSFIFTEQVEVQLGSDEAAKGGAALLTSILELLKILIGESLTLRLVHDFWLKPSQKISKPGE